MASGASGPKRAIFELGVSTSLWLVVLVGIRFMVARIWEAAEGGVKAEGRRLWWRHCRVGAKVSHASAH